MLQPLEESELWKGLGRKKEIFQELPKAEPSQPPEMAGRKNEIIPIKYSAFREEGLRGGCEHAHPGLEGWAVHRVRNRGLWDCLAPHNPN